MGDDAFVDELLFVDFPEGRAIGDLAGDDRLGERRLIRLVVALAAVAIHVDDDVAAELLAELEGEERGPVEFHRLLAVHMEDGSLDHLGDVRRIGRRTRIRRHGGETDLVVDDDVDRAAGAVAGKLREIEHLRHRALAGEGRITVKKNRQHLAAIDFLRLRPR